MISILGCSGVGKSTLIKSIEVKLSDVKVISENVDEVLSKMKYTSTSDPYEKFIATQEAFIDRDIFQLDSGEECLVFDNRLAEYIFYLLHHPDFIDRKDESYARLETKIDCILNKPRITSFYISDSLECIEARVKMDASRTRNFWSFFVENFYPHHEKWHCDNGAYVIEVNGRSPDAVAEEILSVL
ncbi:AAA family ATPase [Catenovulum sediminis]|uniref:AAA family ATPase n=1 Tax=Catenovulum sediminis TaxID=1740262 RepID=A0ABV1REX2_9ALTE